LVAATSVVAHADPAPSVHAGAEAAPAGAVGEPVLKQELDGRRNVRGCTVGDTCARPSDLLREIDVELFPRPGASPWIDERTAPPARLDLGLAPRRAIKR